MAEIKEATIISTTSRINKEVEIMEDKEATKIPLTRAARRRQRKLNKKNGTGENDECKNDKIKLETGTSTTKVGDNKDNNSPSVGDNKLFMTSIAPRNRPERKLMAEKTIKMCNDGKYISYNGNEVVIYDALENAKFNSILYKFTPIIDNPVNNSVSIPVNTPDASKVSTSSHTARIDTDCIGIPVTSIDRSDASKVGISSHTTKVGNSSHTTKVGNSSHTTGVSSSIGKSDAPKVDNNPIDRSDASKVSTSSVGASITAVGSSDTSVGISDTRAGKLNQCNKKYKCKITVTNESTIQACQRLYEEKKDSTSKHICAQNFASAMNQGGGFITGAVAQEEHNCHLSGLYPCLINERMSGYYENNKKVGGRNMYGEYKIWTPHVPVFKDAETYQLLDKPFPVSFITCPAVNHKCAPDPGRFDLAEGWKRRANNMMTFRIRDVLTIALYHGVTDLVLGAFGCGVFGNSPRTIAKIYHDVLSEPLFQNAFDNIVFAIYASSESDKNLTEFRNVFGNYDKDNRLIPGNVDGKIKAWSRDNKDINKRDRDSKDSKLPSIGMGVENDIRSVRDINKDRDGKDGDGKDIVSNKKDKYKKDRDGNIKDMNIKVGTSDRDKKDKGKIFIDRNIKSEDVKKNASNRRYNDKPDVEEINEEVDVNIEMLESIALNDDNKSDVIVKPRLTDDNKPKPTSEYKSGKFNEYKNQLPRAPIMVGNAKHLRSIILHALNLKGSNTSHTTKTTPASKTTGISSTISLINKSKTQCILFMSASFNPIHKEHLSIFKIAKEYVENKLGHQVIAGILSVSSDEHVKRKTSSMSLAHRAQMCRLAVQDEGIDSWVYVCGWGIASGPAVQQKIRNVFADTPCRNFIFAEVGGLDYVVNRQKWRGIRGSDILLCFARDYDGMERDLNAARDAMGRQNNFYLLEQGLNIVVDQSLSTSSLSSSSLSSSSTSTSSLSTSSTSSSTSTSSTSSSSSSSSSSTSTSSTSLSSSSSSSTSLSLSTPTSSTPKISGERKIPSISEERKIPSISEEEKYHQHRVK